MRSVCKRGVTLATAVGVASGGARRVSVGLVTATGLFVGVGLGAPTVMVAGSDGLQATQASSQSATPVQWRKCLAKRTGI